MEEIYFSDLTTRQRCFKFLRKHWKGIFIIVWPILCSPILLVTDGGKALRCGFLILLMSGFWITECIPSHITSIMPIVFLPALGILSSQITCENYFKDTIIMFMCGIMIALLIEFTHLNMRIAFVAVKLVGPSPRRINFAMMVLTGFISTWISNTAATAMMCPIIKGILSSLGSHGIDIYEAKDVEANVPIKKRRPSKLAIAMYVSTCYAATMEDVGQSLVPQQQ
uniref:Citrate transporter-like domain-containing protein n=1 Tax=Megaselia scalaris TaxID=36166 RepID=T1GPR5_MEGSC